MWIKVENQFSYYTLSNISGVLTSGVKSVQVKYRGDGEQAGLFLILVTNLVTPSESFYFVTDRISDDMDFTTNIPQLGGNSRFTFANLAPLSSEGIATYYTDGTRLITVDFGTSYWGTVYGFYRFFTNGHQPTDTTHNIVRYGRDGVLLTFLDAITLSTSAHNSESIYTTALDNNVAFLTLVGEDPNAIQAESRANFVDQEYKYGYSDAGLWSGWYRLASSGAEGEYLPFGGESSSINVGYYKYMSDGKTYIMESEITENSGVWSVVSQINGEIYTTNTRPTDSQTTFTNSEVEPTELVLNFIGYVSQDKLIHNFMIGTVTA